jgi:tRNA-2-methylthio-N6-dimethylallyladenosine synthase
MNIADSDDLRRELLLRGYHEADESRTADVLIVNTCSVRENAELRAKTRIRELGRIKKPDSQLWIIGCMAQRLGNSLKKEIKEINAVIGTSESASFLQNIDLYLPEYEYTKNQKQVNDAVSDYVAVMRGCNNFCSYCIVPYVRGSEQSVPIQEIIKKIQDRVNEGIVEFTLLGQNVNSYRDRNTDFADLLKSVASIDGVKRVRFTTSHPKDCSEKLIRTIAETNVLCKHIHLPVQAGSNRVLNAMNRKYSVEHYRNQVSMIRSYLPDADITSDLMVGFPGETESEFEDTLRLVEEIQFTTAFMFAFSPRMGTAAASLHDMVPSEIKSERLKKLIDLQTSITKKLYNSMIGKELEVMISGKQDKRDKLWMGMDDGFKKVLLSCDDARAGMILRVRVSRSSGMTLISERIS